MRETDEQKEMIDFKIHGDGVVTVHLNGSGTFITRRDQEASAYLKGRTQ